MNAQFISLEGLEGAGKTTQAERVCSWLARKKKPYLHTREPGGTALAEQIRTLILQSNQEIIEPETELLLVFAARTQHVNRVIKPALAKGTWVVSERFTDATYAYQGGGRGILSTTIEQLEQLALQDFRPNLTLWLDCDAATGLGRARARGQLDRIESEAVDFFERCRGAYRQRAQAEPERVLRVDAAASAEVVSASIVAALEQRYAGLT